MKYTLKDFVGTFLMLAAVIMFILVIASAGALDQNLVSFGDGAKRILICLGVFIAIVIVLFLMCRDDEED